MDSGASNEVQPGCPLPTLLPGQIPWKNVASPSERAERDTENQLPLYYNTPSDGNHSTNTPSPFPTSQEAPSSALIYQNDSERYQQQDSSMPPRMNQPAPGLYQPNTTWSGHSSQVQPYIPSDLAKPNGQSPSTTTSRAFPFQPPGKSVSSSWYRPSYPSVYPPYGNDGHHKKAYSHPDMTGPITYSEPSTLQSSSNNGSTQHQHIPMLTSHPQYTHNNGSQSNEGRTANVLSREMRPPQLNMGSTERNVYPALPNSHPTGYYIPQTSHTPRQPNMTQFSRPIGLNHPVVPPYSINPPATGHGRGKNRANKSYQCPKCAKVFRRGDHLKRHLLSVHDHEHPYQCGDCGKGFASVTALLKHAKSLHVGNLAKGLMCLRCQLTFMSMQEIESHAGSLHVQEDETYMQNINTSSKQHSCISCSKTFTSAAHLKRHMQLNHRSKDDSKIFCRECGKSFARIDALRKHIDKTHNGNPNALPPDDLDDADNSRQTTFSEGDSRGPSADNDESSVSTPSHVATQWGPGPPSQAPIDRPKSNNSISNTQIVPSSVSYQKGPASQPQLPVSDVKGQQIRGMIVNSVDRPLIPPLPVVPPQSLSPHKDPDNPKGSQTSCITPAQRGSDITVTTENSSSGKNHVYANDRRTQHMQEQTVSEVFSIAMRTLSEFDYESTDELMPQSFDTMLPLAIAHHNRNGSLPRNHYPTNCSASESVTPGIIPTVLQPEPQHLNSNKYHVSSRPQRNFLMTMPPPPDATMGCPSTRLNMAPGIMRMPHQRSLHHQGGGGGVKIPIVNLNRNHAVSIVNQRPIQTTQTSDGIGFDKILSDLQKTASPKSVTTHGHIDASQEKVDLSCAVCKTQYNSIDDLMTHVEGVHLKANPHECCICKKHFAQAGNVKRHIRFVHLRERPFRCKDCSCTFDRLCYLQRHMRTHLQWNEENQEFNPLKPCFCPECGKRCLTAHHLRGHMQRKHFAKNKQNYSEFLVKYGHLEALGNGPGALASQRGRRGRRKKSVNLEVIDHGISTGKNPYGTKPTSSPKSHSSMDTQPLSALSDTPLSSQQNKNLQMKQLTYHKPHHTIQSDVLQSARHPFKSYVPGCNEESFSANHPFATQPKMPNVCTLQHSYAHASELQSHTSYNYRQNHVGHSMVGDYQAEKKAERVEGILRRRAFCSRRKKKLLLFRCSYCVIRHFCSLEMLRSHVALRHGSALKKYVCCKCGESFAKRKLLFAHKTKYHTQNTCLLSRMKKPTSDSEAKLSTHVNALTIGYPTQTALVNKHFAMQIHQQNQRSFDSCTSQMNYFNYDSNSPAMVPSPNVDTMYRNPSHHINTSMPLIQT